MPKICLNMIVKNESNIIKRLLSSVLPLIDTYCICDTGSTDNTIDIIKTFFDNVNIAGKIVEEPFRDFGYNRSFSLSQCHGMQNADYILLLDADMVLEIDPRMSIIEFKESLIKDAYYLLQGNDKFHYKNIRIVKNNGKYKYWGVTHEYVVLPDNTSAYNISKSMLFIDDIGDGGAKTDKFIRDIKLLKQGLQDNPDNDRYTFYLANSYKDSGQFQSAIETYEKRIELKGWKQEVWYSYYSIGLCYKELDDMKNALYYWMEGYNYLPERIETLYEIMNYYRISKRYTLVDVFYNLAKKSCATINESEQLFFKKDVYDYKLDYEFSVAGFYSNQNNINMSEVFMRVFNYPIHKNLFNNTLSNFKYYVASLFDMKMRDTYNIQLLNNNESITQNYPHLFSSTPTICYNMNKSKLYTNTRLVNYFIDDNGSYKCKNNEGIVTTNEQILTKNVCRVYNVNDGKWIKEKEFELKYNTEYDGVYVGLEDIRLLSNRLGLCFNANRGISYGKIMIETGVIDMYSQETNSTLVYKDGSKNVEKNWVLFNTITNRVKVIYKWFPLTIGEYLYNETYDNPSTFFTTNTLQMPVIFKYVRGSTNGVIIGNEIWFITHLVNDETQRHYYHMFVVLDIETYKLKRYSIPFTFEKKNIEYTLGFIFNENTQTFIIGYSTMDRTTNYIEISTTTIRGLFV